MWDRIYLHKSCAHQYAKCDGATRMSVVCRRWHKIWEYTIRRTPRLTFVLWNRLKRNWGWTGTVEMIGLVNRITKLHKARTLEELAIDFTLCWDHCGCIKKWLDIAGKKKVKKLSLEFDPDIPSFRHLLTNTIRRYYIRETHKLNIVPPPNLKFLKITQSSEYSSLKYIEISSSSSSDHHHQNQHPILNLMEMEMDTCHPPSANIKINISAPNLSYLVLIEMPADQVPEFSKLERLHFQMRLDKYIPEIEKANGEHSYQYLKVVKLDSFDGCKYEVELVFHLLEYAVAVEKVIIQLLPSEVWKSP
ncbi:hypothetical protein FEM48_Zijuj02G0148500 [Ziziphus jujuba var. spinosa]|uniref:Uncharacterized protein n=1 Tax=Ziziphus jujuba var. spinosa TaxID=714518 RepID=A0A978VWB6_ZIZJJ|nr:hypothetical protein FEM48_Zijuj02G0148500 [Ziziphus jujuba var. spinosa]